MSLSFLKPSIIQITAGLKAAPPCEQDEQGDQNPLISAALTERCELSTKKSARERNTAQHKQLICTFLLSEVDLKAAGRVGLSGGRGLMPESSRGEITGTDGLLTSHSANKHPDSDPDDVFRVCGNRETVHDGCSCCS